MLNAMLWTTLGLTGTGGLLFTRHQTLVRAAGTALLIAGVLLGVATAILEPL